MSGVANVTALIERISGTLKHPCHRLTPPDRCLRDRLPLQVLATTANRSTDTASRRAARKAVRS
jgi:hypothetical protein